MRSAAPAVSTPVEDPVEAEERVPGGIERAARLFVGMLPYGETDPRKLLGEIAILLARRVDDSGAVPAAVRELRTLLMQLAEAPNGPAGKVDELRLAAHRRELEGILASLPER